MTRYNTLLAAAAALVISAGGVFAQATTAPTTGPAVTPKAPPSAMTPPTTMSPPTTTMTPSPKVAKVRKPAAPRTEKSIKCSADATAAGLKGKPRKAFMTKCKKAP